MDNLPTPREIAAKIISELFANHQRVTVAAASAAAEDAGISTVTLRRVAREMGVVTIMRGKAGGGYWERS